MVLCHLKRLVRVMRSVKTVEDTKRVDEMRTTQMCRDIWHSSAGVHTREYSIKLELLVDVLVPLPHIGGTVDRHDGGCRCDCAKKKNN